MNSFNNEENENFDDKYEINTENSLEADDKIKNLSQKGYKLIKANLLHDAIEIFKEILIIDSKNKYALIGIGDAYKRQNNFESALKYYYECYEVHPENNYAHYGIAECYRKTNKFMNAIEFYKKFLASNPENINILINLADAYRKLENFQLAKAEYLKVLILEPHNKYALTGLGYLYFETNEFEKALELWNKTVKENKYVDAKIWTAIGNCHRKLKTFDDGIKAFSNALKIDENNFFALLGMADCYRGVQNYKKSYKYWEKLLSLEPNNKIILTRIGDACRNLKKYDKAKEFYEKALSIEFDMYAIIGLALICKDNKEYLKAIEILGKAKKNKHYRIYTEIADCYVKMDQKEKAIEILKSFKDTGLKSSFVDEMLSKLIKK